MEYKLVTQVQDAGGRDFLSIRFVTVLIKINFVLGK